jgi:hypothetical protein
MCNEAQETNIYKLKFFIMNTIKEKKQVINSNVKIAKKEIKNELNSLFTVFNIAKKQQGFQVFKSKQFQAVSLNSQLTFRQFVSVLRNERKYSVETVVSCMKAFLVSSVENELYNINDVTNVNKGTEIDAFFTNGLEISVNIENYLNKFTPELSQADFDLLNKYGIDCEKYIHLLKAIKVSKAKKVNPVANIDFQAMEEIISAKLSA